MDKPKMAVKDSHRKAAGAFLDSRVGVFRRSDISAVLYPLTSPRSRPKADTLADAVMRELSKAGSIQRHGHLHWIKVTGERVRKLRSGRTTPELDGVVNLSLSTHCPKKWVSVDLETGDVWVGSEAGWRRATDVERVEAHNILG